MGRIESIVFEDEIVLYWEKAADVRETGYEIWCNGGKVGETDKTHFTLTGLIACTDYGIEIKSLPTGNLERVTLTTGKAKRRIDVTAAPYNAVGDGNILNTVALQKALDDCKEDEVVYLPRGIYLTGALRMHSDIELYLEEGAVLQGTDRVEDYRPKIWSRFEGTELYCYSSLLNLGELDHEVGYNCCNVIIRGKGTIASGGRVLAERVIAVETENMKEQLEALGEQIKECENERTIPGRVRPRLINMSNCQNIILSGVTLRNGASWNVHMIYSDTIVTNHCNFYTGEDSIAIKSGKNPEGNKIGRPTKHIRIFDCRCAYGHGITIGSEMSGGGEDVRIWDCDMSSSLFGIEIKGTWKRGGYVRNVHATDCKVTRVLLHSVGYNNDGIAADVQPYFEDCSFENLSISGKYYDHYKEERGYCDAIELIGFDEPGHELKKILHFVISQ